MDLQTLRERIGAEVGVSDWVHVTQDRIDQFASVTGDAQWIHVDPARASSTPWRGTVAHGFLTLSLITIMLEEAVPIAGTGMAINYGLNRVRFPAPLPAGSRVRARATPLAVESPSDDVTQVTWRITVEREGGEKPCCVAEWVVRYYGG